MNGTFLSPGATSILDSADVPKYASKEFYAGTTESRRTPSGEYQYVPGTPNADNGTKC